MSLEEKLSRINLFRLRLTEKYAATEISTQQDIEILEIQLLREQKILDLAIIEAYLDDVLDEALRIQYKEQESLLTEEIEIIDNELSNVLEKYDLKEE